MLKKASETEHKAKQGKDDEKCELEGDACVAVSSKEGVECGMKRSTRLNVHAKIFF
jgi:hypothetical protein